MTVEINNPGVDTQQATPEVAEAPLDLGQAEPTESQAVEQVEIGTDKQEVYSPENYKKLQAEFTRKSQEFSEFQKRYSKEAEELATFRQMYAKEQTAQQQPPRQTTNKTLSAKEFANLEPMEQLNYLVDQRINEVVNPYVAKIQQLEGYIQHTQQVEAQRTWNEFVAAHPDAANMAGELAQIISQHNMPIDKAYKLLKADMAVPEAKQEVLKEIEAKKDASKIMKPVSTPTTPANTKVSSFEEAFEKAKKELGMK